MRELLRSERLWWWASVFVLALLTQLVTCGLHAHVTAFQYVWMFGMAVLGFTKLADGVSWIVTHVRKL